jgi:hypothetical protein
LKESDAMLALDPLQGTAMKWITDVITVLVVGAILGSVVYLAQTWPFHDLAQGELRCEGAGAVVLRVGGKDYAVNGMASNRYPPVQRAWNSKSYPETDIDRLIARGLTLCDWESKATRYLTATRDK